MGNSEEGKSNKVEKPTSPVATDQANQINPGNIHLYPDWAAMQAYYGPRVTMPPYYNSAMAPAHAPHPYMWPPQPMMPPYGAPYAAIYSPGGVYPHPAVPIGGTPLSMETPTKSSGNTDQGLMKKLKEFDGLAMSIGNGNGNAVSAERGIENGLSHSEDTEGSTDGSDGNTTGANQTRRKRSREGTPTTGGEGKAEMQADKKMAIVPTGVPGKLAGPVVSSVIPPEAWLQNERELKRERRKQSNRESARRSRLRKQAETEELARKVESLNAENVTLKSEVNRLTDNSAKLRAENAALMEKLKNVQQGQTEEIVLNGVDGKRATPISTENLLSRVNNSSSNDITTEEENDYCDEKQNSSAKLHQLLDTSPRADAVAAG